ncbi:16899_t:CDS:2 [Funneliformis mosseae]|uniref:16899_t:CDS:1 n=1 Tax=Funneliformis mosseae TaxID=27381 RepID=A0A9N9AIQ5_FUNMO|nr:16899_t:CDS:2 [Funneliformis mosseae]
MRSIKRIFSNASTSPSEPTKTSSPRHARFFRSNSGPIIIDSTQDKKSTKSAGALHLDTSVQQQFRYHSAANSPISYNAQSYNTTPTPTTATSSPIDTELFNYQRQSNPLISSQLINRQKNIPSINISIPPFTPVDQPSPTTRQNQADEFIRQAIQYHEANELEKATYYFKLAADKDSPLGLFLYGIALRHGWGCKPNPKLAVRFLQKAAESAVHDLHTTMAANPSIARHELVLAIYELGVCFRHGWGVPKNKQTAAYYFEIAASFGDPDAQNDIGFCYANGEGVKKDMKKAAKFYRSAAAQGASILGNSWIYKKKYDD